MTERKPPHEHKRPGRKPVERPDGPLAQFSIRVPSTWLDDLQVLGLIHGTVAEACTAAIRKAIDGMTPEMRALADQIRAVRAQVKK